MTAIQTPVTRIFWIDMKVLFCVEVDETQTDKTMLELVDMGMKALVEAYEQTGAYFDVGYDPRMVTSGKGN